MAIFTIADLHLSFSSDKPMDVFGGWENHAEQIKQNWLKTVQEDDHVIIPGDFSWAMRIEQALEDFKFIENLPGTKYILKGNHDYWWTTAGKMKNFFEENGLNSIKIIHNNAFEAEGHALCGSRGWFYEDEGERKIILREALRLEASIVAGKKLSENILVFLHYPPISQNHDVLEIVEVLSKHKVKKCYYGHIHGKGCNYAFQGVKHGIEFKLISADYLRFNPLKIV